MWRIETTDVFDSWFSALNDEMLPFAERELTNYLKKSEKRE
ncbi:hypothetical protein Pcaca03_37330 [Pectobacterium carotovorum subsp. carotovorum]|uniref:Uncharacterized protein n=1 Tax=Pectobacterium carotovorum subsp. carotovorum TaxID=555 RepID=A0AAI9L570_PECCC|nr:hypothetical protein SOASR016_34950 [Pectobacterium carotovorum subsp. carotovorum]GLV71289.1 hypothetical protein Pcaca03_37330 [Pectobacterium carotovorum subsp. carotovorum]